MPKTWESRLLIANMVAGLAAVEWLRRKQKDPDFPVSKIRTEQVIGQAAGVVAWAYVLRHLEKKLSS
jgi:hypothetical protein